MEEQNKAKKRWSRLKQTYQLVLRKDETFEEVYTVQLTPLNVYVIVSTIFLLVTIAVVSILIFTPLKTYIPGYADITNNKVYMELLRKTEQLEEDMEGQELYIEGLRRLILSDPQYAQELNLDTNIQGEEVDIVARIPEDDIIRQEVSLEDQLSVPEGSLINGSGAASRNIELNMIPPVRGMVSMGFSNEKQHYGVDIISSANTPVKSILDGYVISSGWNVQTGHTIMIQHQNDIVSVYKHNSAILSETGDFVRAGEAIAIIGNTGIHTDGPHLHFELWREGKALDPMSFIDFVGKKSNLTPVN